MKTLLLYSSWMPLLILNAFAECETVIKEKFILVGYSKQLGDGDLFQFLRDVRIETAWGLEDDLP